MTAAERFASVGSLLVALYTGCGEPPVQDRDQPRRPNGRLRTDAKSTMSPILFVPSSVPTMREARAVHTASALQDGTILVAGGLAGEQTLRTTEVFDLSKGAFRPGPALGAARAAHTATVLRDGRVLFAGGLAGSIALSSAELYDPSTGAMTSTGSMHVARSGHIAVLLADGRVLIAGGVGDGWSFLPSVEIFDPRDGRFSVERQCPSPESPTPAPSLRMAPCSSSAGIKGDAKASYSTHLPSRMIQRATQWTEAGRMSVRRHKHDAVRLADGRVLVVGGTDERDARGTYTSAEIFNPATRRFDRTSDSRLAHWKHAGTSVLLRNGQSPRGIGRRATRALHASNWYLRGRSRYFQDAWPVCCNCSAAER